MDPSGYMLGEFFSVISGIVLGATIVSLCWGASNTRDLRRDNQPKLEAEEAKALCEAELLRRLIDREKGQN
jgi:hypothetical protein